MAKIEIQYLNDLGSYDILYPEGSGLSIEQTGSFIGNSQNNISSINLNLGSSLIRNYGVPIFIYFPETKITSNANQLMAYGRNVSTQEITSFSTQAFCFVNGKAENTDVYNYNGLLFLYDVNISSNIMGYPSTFIKIKGTIYGPKTAVPGVSIFTIETTKTCDYEIFTYSGNPLNINGQQYTYTAFVLRGGLIT